MSQSVKRQGAMMTKWRIGIDENGLGPQLGPLVVTGCLLSAGPRGKKLLNGELPPALRRDLDDSKALVSNKDVSLGEAWARVVVERMTGKAPKSHQELLATLSIDPLSTLQKICPSQSKRQCWNTQGEKFSAKPELLVRLKKHLEWLENRDIEPCGLSTVVICTSRLNSLKREGVHRFAADLHAMERLILDLSQKSEEPVEAICGKVGGIAEYGKYFRYLSTHLFNILQEGREKSSYRFPEIGDVHFIKDADASDPAVMLSSLVGKYVRELTMKRIGRYYLSSLPSGTKMPSGYHDPVSDQFVQLTQRLREKENIPDDCFQRSRSEKTSARRKKTKTASPPPKKKKTAEKRQGSLF
ncbi:MAG: hypothetical protein MK135_00195 [Polyangiaceae bacterium]|nr:hypothetical protein [Polyangiaceae bacterium]